jgi:hypothetical protein
MNGSFELGVESRSFSFGLMRKLTSVEAFVVQLTSAHSSRAGFLLHRRGAVPFAHERMFAAHAFLVPTLSTLEIACAQPEGVSRCQLALAIYCSHVRYNVMLRWSASLGTRES